MKREPLQLEQQSNLSSEYEGEEQLVVDIIRQAIKDYQGDNQLEHGKAEAWLFSDSEEPYSLIWCCDILHVSPQLILERI